MRSTGYGIIKVGERKQLSVIDYGCIKNAASLTHSQCLLAIYKKIATLIDEHRPVAAAVEGIIYVQNRSIAIGMGAARGAALVALAEGEIPVHEYPAKSVKKAATGFGSAQKRQVGFMMRALLSLRETPPPDAADALAIALTHVQLNKVAVTGTGRTI